MMEKRKVNGYHAGYSNPDPFGSGRWYETVTQEKIDEFNRGEEEMKKRQLLLQEKHTFLMILMTFMETLYIFCFIRRKVTYEHLTYSYKTVQPSLQVLL